ncbi:MAG: hypothetical protein IPK88_19675 [Saprospiraceae bacterium]|nr:hypothetical protein [Candidatus Defluviibacterium haderslevense]MBL0237099.1 hypothetical protein [Candidatus Defluviibacterium haderslevense]
MNSDRLSSVVLPFMLGVALGGIATICYSFFKCSNSKLPKVSKNTENETEGYYVE